MKRLGGDIYNQIISVKNLTLAHRNASKGKKKQKGVIKFNKDADKNILELHETLKNEDYKSPKYKIFKIYEPKEREIYVTPYEDRIIQHAILQKISDMFVKNFTKHTYSCIKKRGLHLALKGIKKVLKDKAGTKYCLKIDITKFYPTVDHDILKSLLLRKIKCKKLIKLLFRIIDGAPGLPIGNYLSQYFGNFYLSPFDHWLKEELKIKHVWRYCDDVVILGNNKAKLHEIRQKIEAYLKDNLKVKVKSNHQVFPIKSRGIDFLGYVIFHEHVKLRTTIKKKFAKMIRYNPNLQSIAAYSGWLKHCNGVNLKRKLLNSICIYEI